MKKFIYVVVLVSISVVGFMYFSKPVNADSTLDDASILSNLIKNNENSDDDRSLLIPAFDDTNFFYFWMWRKTELFGSNKVYTVVPIVSEVDNSYLQVWDVGTNGYELMNSYTNVDLIEIQSNSLLLFRNGYQDYTISRSTYSNYAFFKVIVPPLDTQEAYESGYKDARSDYAEFFPPGSSDGFNGWYGYQDGYDYGVDVGYDDAKNYFGYNDNGIIVPGQDAYIKGRNEAIQESGDLRVDIINFVPGVLGVIFMFFFQLGQIGILGITILDIIGILVLITGLIFLIKFFF